jgi:SWI/SNF-related matrix-associated actin-dependent regulator 1 of chromatin subfamily A
MKKQYNYSAKTLPLPHQIDAINFIKDHSLVPLFDDQGLGKTKIVIDSLGYSLESREIDNVLVICKKTLLKTWTREITKHSHLDFTILAGGRRQRGRALMRLTKYYLIGYESLLKELDRIKLLLDLRPFAIVLDESQKIKNPTSRITKAVLDISSMSKKKIIISGSALTNKPDDLWSQFYFLDGGKTLGANYNDFKRRFSVSLKGKSSLEHYNRSLSELRETISNLSIRRTKDVLELPEKIYSNIYVDLKGRQKEIYERALHELTIEIKNTDGSVIINHIDNYLVKLLRLTQIASNPKLIDDSYSEEPIKLKKIDELVKGITSKSEKVIIWSCFRENIRMLKNRYLDYGAVMLFGEMNTEEKNASIDKFQDLPTHRVMIANPSVASVGLTLTSANNAIYLDRNFKMDDYVQSQDRIHRIGQSKKCNIFKVLAKDTIDEYTDDIIEKKHLIMRYCLGDVDSLKTDKVFMTKDDILKILEGE